MNRIEQIASEVATKRNYIWDAYDQGRWSAASGHKRESNPHIPGHVNRSDWFRGFDVESK